MSNEKNMTELSRALFELRCGRVIRVDNLIFCAYELAENTGSSEVIAPVAMDQAMKPANTNEPVTSAELLALELLKRAGMLPLAVKVETMEPSMEFSADALGDALQMGEVEVKEMARASLPIKQAENTKIVSFRSPASAAEHLAIIIGDPKIEEAPLVRVHSSCITGDLLGSLRCDCGDQLALAIKQIAQAGQGVICYLQQEGRGIGISNKIRAYALQEKGMDTLDANLALGFAADERDFALAAAMLKALDISDITLLSNNPDKRAQLEQSGITVKAQQSLSTPANDHNARYIETKTTRLGHDIKKRFF